MKIKTAVGLIAMLMILSNTGIASAVAPQDPESPQLFVILEDDKGGLYGLYLYYSVILYGLYYSPSSGVLWPTYGLILGNEMVLWIDAPGTGSYVDSFAIIGEWNLASLKFSGRWVNFDYPSTYWTGGIQMWLYGTATPIKGREEEVSFLTTQSPINHCFKDSQGFNWDLTLEFGIVYHGTVKLYQTWPAYGYTVGNEMFLWANAPENPSVHDFIYIGKSSGTGQKYFGVWLDPEGPWTGLVSWWSC